MIRVLIAEDSRTSRELLQAILASDPEIEVAGQARDGAEAVELARQLRPDLVTMDIHMPMLDGLEATREIMITAPTPIVIVTGSSAVKAIEFSMHALRAGALDVLAKPPAPGSPLFAEAARKLIATVKAMAQVKVVRQWRSETAAGPYDLRGRAPCRRRRAEVVAIAASTGGPAALQRVFEGLSGGAAVPILVVQHITPGFVPGLAGWLNSVCALHVKVAEQGEPLAPRTVYLAPDDRHLGVSAGRAVALSNQPPVGGFRPSGTYLFESVAQEYGPAAVAVILTGMGQDGVEGLAAVRREGGWVIAQDEASSVVFGMPGAAVAAGVADQVVPLEEISARLVEML